MIIGLGIDIVEVDRMERAIERWGDSFLRKVFTEREIGYSGRRRYSSQHLAARFAAKEAVVKAFGEPRAFPVRWTDIEVINDAEGKPIVELRNDALKAKKAKGVTGVVLSLSHTKEHAVANALLVKE